MSITPGSRSCPPLVLAACVLVGAGAALAGNLTVTDLGSGVVTVREYANPFDPNLDRNLSESTVTVGGGFNPGSSAQIVNRGDHRQTDGRIYLNDAGSAPGPATYVQFDAPVPFAAETILTWRYVWSGFDNDMPAELKLASGSPDWSAVTPVYSQPGTRGTAAFEILNPGGTYDSLRVAYPQTAVYRDDAYADFQDVAILPEKLTPLPTTITASNTT